MRPWDIVDHETVPSGDETIILMSRGREWVIHVDGRELMGNRHWGSEVALADAACDRLDRLDNARILVGGLGMGFTLAAALNRVGADGHVTVAELMPAVVRWNREHVGQAAKHPLRDPRANVFLGDVADLVDGAKRDWSAILLDVDNGPRALTRPTNGWLYTEHGLATLGAALIPGGVLGIWSAWADKSLTNRLRKRGSEVDVIRHVEPAGRPPSTTGCTSCGWRARRADQR